LLILRNAASLLRNAAHRLILRKAAALPVSSRFLRRRPNLFGGGRDKEFFLAGGTRNGDVIMKMKVITGIALGLATLLTSPAFAQARGPLNYNGAPYDAYAQAYGPQEETIVHRAERQPHRSWDVYNTNGLFVGRDPDPNVRDMIARDRSEQFDSGF
jgi:hypothetical protein